MGCWPPQWLTRLVAHFGGLGAHIGRLVALSVHLTVSALRAGRCGALPATAKVSKSQGQPSGAAAKGNTLLPLCSGERRAPTRRVGAKTTAQPPRARTHAKQRGVTPPFRRVRGWPSDVSSGANVCRQATEAFNDRSPATSGLALTRAVLIRCTRARCVHAPTGIQWLVAIHERWCSHPVHPGALQSRIMSSSWFLIMLLAHRLHVSAMCVRPSCWQGGREGWHAAVVVECLCPQPPHRSDSRTALEACTKVSCTYVLYI